MANSNQQFPGDFQIESIILEPIPGTYTGPLGQQIDIRELMVEMSIYQSILSPSVSADILVSDSGKNLISNIPLMGQEKVTIKLGTPNGKKYTLVFFVHKISGRTLKEKNQAYIMHLCSFELIINECARISQRFRGLHPHDIVQNILEENLKTSKKIVTDPSLHPVDFIAPFWRPFDVINWLAKRSVSTTTADSCGYLFYETLSVDPIGSDNQAGGYVFSSIDTLIQLQKSSTLDVFTYAPAKTGDKPDEKLYRIKNFRSPEVFNHLEDLRMGLYAHYSIDIDFMNSKKITRNNTVDEWWNGSVAMNNCRAYRSTGQGGLHPSKFATRVIYRPLANQLWDEPGATNSSPNTTEDLDKLNTMFDKAIFRFHMLNYNKLEIEVPGNMDLVPAKLIKISIPSPETKEGDDQTRKEDKKLSGIYMIESIRHSLNRSQMFTHITLIRDSIGGNQTEDPAFPVESEDSTLGENSNKQP